MTFAYSYFKRRKQGVEIRDTGSFFQILLSGVLQGSILGPILSNILFINDLFLFIKDIELSNFADDGTIYAEKNDINELIKLLEKESKPAVGLV